MKRVLLLAAAFAAAAIVPAAAHAATARPKVVSLTVSPKHLTSTGGRVTVKARVTGAKACAVTETRGTTVAATKAVACSRGTATATFTSAASRTQTALTLHFAFRATGASGATARASVTAVQDGVGPLSVVAAAGISSGIVGSGYSTALLADGGLAPYRWSLVSGTLPDGLTLSGDGTLAGTPTTISQTTFVAQVTDALGSTATAAYTLVVTTPTLTNEHSKNWSGYVYRGGPFTSVTGTFNVPTASAGAGTDVAEWIGIDGDSNSDLIQAGIAETVSGVSGRVQVYAWWEILPASETPISMPVAAGDQVTVTITQNASSLWAIRIVDNTSGQSFQTLQSYSGSLASAEWILEAPTSGRGSQLSLASFSPNVTFTRLGANGPVDEIAAVSMVQDDVVATPSARSATGFSVGYGSAAPDAP